MVSPPVTHVATVAATTSPVVAKSPAPIAKPAAIPAHAAAAAPHPDTHIAAIRAKAPSARLSLAFARPPATLPVKTATATVVPSPRVLSTADAGHYAAIFALQDEGAWKAADFHMNALHDRVLLGTAEAQRYLSPSYSASFAQLRAWLVSYADQPEARAIWNLAKRKGQQRQSVPRPVAETMPAIGHNPAQPVSNDAGRGDALPAAPESAQLSPPSRFRWAINAWKNHRYADAGQAFEAVAEAPRTGSWYVAASAFWAARAHLVLQQPGDVDRWLEIAAQQPRTFYGLLARRLLGMDTGVRVGATELSPRELKLLSSVPSGRRAMALVELGETDRAEAELRALAGRSGRGLANAVVALADIANMPALCLSLSPSVSDSGRRADALYPVPHWQPRNGYSVDRALMFALMMQESAFDTGAASHAGASGLMQLMPRTARTVADSAGIRLKRGTDLVDPEINLSLGQEYVKQLIKHDQIRGNLILMLSAYKEGPANLSELEKRPGYNSDPLLFVESLPHVDTRLYVERVLTNMWIYRQRLGQSVPDLDALAANQWPTYVSLDHRKTRDVPDTLRQQASR